MMVCQICMLQLLVHDDCTICTISSYELGTILCLIVTVNMEFYIIEIIAHEFVFWHLLFRYSFRFVTFLLTLHFAFLSVYTYLLRLCASQICSPFTILPQFPHIELESRTGAHISVEIVRFLLLPNPY